MSELVGTKETRAIGELDRAAPSEGIDAIWPWGAEPASPELVERFEGAIAAWDRHVSDCRSCLHQGQWFCDEGIRLNRRVATIRANFHPPREPRRTVSVSLALGRSVTWQLRADLP